MCGVGGFGWWGWLIGFGLLLGGCCLKFGCVGFGVDGGCWIVLFGFLCVVLLGLSCYFVLEFGFGISGFVVGLAWVCGWFWVWGFVLLLGLFGCWFYLFLFCISVILWLVWVLIVLWF